jgi:hypothetical protein
MNNEAVYWAFEVGWAAAFTSAAIWAFGKKHHRIDWAVAIQSSGALALAVVRQEQGVKRLFLSMERSGTAI